MHTCKFCIDSLKLQLFIIWRKFLKIYYHGLLSLPEKRMKEKRFCRKEKINYQEMKSTDFLMSFMDLKSCLCLF